MRNKEASAPKPPPPASPPPPLKTRRHMQRDKPYPPVMLATLVRKDKLIYVNIAYVTAFEADGKGCIVYVNGGGSIHADGTSLVELMCELALPRTAEEVFAENGGD